jgi:uncharacterized LabA/DUF88 family protein
MKIYVFIDEQNLYLSIKHQGWKLNYQKWYRYLQEKYKADEVFVFLGFISKRKIFYRKLRRIGFRLIFKEVTKYIKNGKTSYKGNIDAELVLYCAKIEYENYDRAVIVSGDGDFKCLVKYLHENGKLARLLIPNKDSFSSLLLSFGKSIDFISDQRRKLKK